MKKSARFAVSFLEQKIRIGKHTVQNIVPMLAIIKAGDFTVTESAVSVGRYLRRYEKNIVFALDSVLDSTRNNTTGRPKKRQGENGWHRFAVAV